MKIILQLSLVFIFNTFFSLSSILAQELKVMTYNIYHGEQFYDRGVSNLEEIAKIITQPLWIENP